MEFLIKINSGLENLELLFLKVLVIETLNFNKNRRSISVQQTFQISSSRFDKPDKLQFPTTIQTRVQGETHSLYYKIHCPLLQSGFPIPTLIVSNLNLKELTDNIGSQKATMQC